MKYHLAKTPRCDVRLCNQVKVEVQQEMNPVLETFEVKKKHEEENPNRNYKASTSTFSCSKLK